MKNIIITCSAALVLQVSTCSNSGISSRSYKSGRTDIINQLYHDAMEQDESLEELNDLVHESNEDFSETMQPFQRYDAQFDAYWTAFSNYLNYFDSDDSTLREEMKQLAERFKASHEKKQQQTNDLRANLEETQNDISTQQIALKLLVSYDQMKKFETKNKPDDSELKRLQSSLTSILAQLRKKNAAIGN